MTIPSLSAGISSGISFGSQGGSSSDLSKKISELKNQREDQQKKLDLNKNDNNAQAKIDSLTRRIDNLEQRLKKAEKQDAEKKMDDGECETCENRKYQDGSNDPGVSFKSASKIAPEAAAAAVRGHEMEHVYRNRAKAEREGKKIVSQSVVLKTDICPECGKSFIAGGETRTVTKTKQENLFKTGLEDKEAARGKFLDKTA